MTEPTPTLPNFDPFNKVDVLEALKEENADILRRKTALEKGADVWDKFPEIKNEAQAEQLTTFLQQIANITGEKGTANVRRTARKGAYDAVAKEVQRYFIDTFIEPLEKRRTTIRERLLKPYLEKKKKAAADEAARLKAEAEKLAATATTEAQVKEAIALNKQAAAAAKAGGVKTDFGQTAHIASTWKFRVKDLNMVPIGYLQINTELVNQTIRGKNGLREIAGLEIYEDTTPVTSN